uniref:cyclin-J-like isoform X2 n=1 Tax=Myxine glutinosa TaxID=7769 RepID=UPI00358E5825
MERDARAWPGPKQQQEDQHRNHKQEQLAADIHQALRLKELKLPVFRGQSPQLPLRRHFIDLLCVLASRFQLSAATRHLAVYLLDLFMDRYDIAVKQLYVAALSCLVLASKFEEREERVPKLDQLNNIGFMGQLPLRLGRTELRQMELLLLDAFQWNLCLPTAALFLDYYLAVSGPDADVSSAWMPGRPHKIYYYLEKYAQYFLEVSLQDHVYLRFYPSQVAAGCVAAARACLHLSPTWPPQFQRLTNYSWDHLAPCMELLLLAHDNDSKEASKQSPLQQHSPRPQHICEVPFPNSPVHHHSLHLPRESGPAAQPATCTSSPPSPSSAWTSSGYRHYTGIWACGPRGDNGAQIPGSGKLPPGSTAGISSAKPPPSHIRTGYGD